MRQHFRIEQFLPYPREVVFAFFANPDNLPRLMPHWQQVRIERMTLSPAPEPPPGTKRLGTAAGSGTEMLLTAKAFPLAPFRSEWLARIEDFRWNDSFCDLQLRGPFRYWRHCHSVRDAAQQGTFVRDAIEFELPVSIFSAPAAKMALTAGFRFRQHRALELMPAFAAAYKAAVMS